MALSFFGEEAPEDRQTLTETFSEEGIGAGLKQTAQMLLPGSAFQQGGSDASSIFQDFVEFSPVGDVQDVAMAINPNSGLDWLERGIAALPVAGLTVAGGVALQKSNILARRQALAAQRAQLSTAVAGELHRPQEGFEGGFESEPLLRRKQAAALAEKAEPSFGIWETSDFQELADASGPVWSSGRAPAEAVRAVGHQIIREAPGQYGDGTDLEADALIAAQSALSRFQKATKAGIYKVNGASSRYLSPFEAVDLSFLVNFEHQARRLGMGPGSIAPTPQTALARVVRNDADGTVEVYGGVRGELLPTQRLLDPATNQPLSRDVRDQMKVRQLASDPETLVGDYAANIARTGLEEMSKNPDRWNRSVTWYQRANKTVKSMSAATGQSHQTIAAVLSALSPQNKWAPDNLVAGLHTVVRYTLPDLDPASPEYRTKIVEAIDAGDWWEDILGGLSKANRERFSSREKLADYVSDVNNLETSTGNTLGMTDDRKKLSASLLLLADLPWQLVLRMQKTHLFSNLIADPSTAGAVVDTHSDSAAHGTIWVAEPLGSKGVRKLSQAELDAGYTMPSGKQITAADILKAADNLESLGLEANTTLIGSDQRGTTVEQLLAGFRTVPSDSSLVRYGAIQEAHELAREVLGLEHTHQVQSGTWVPTQSRKDLVNRIRRAEDPAAVDRAMKLATWDRSVVDHLEGNPSLLATPAGILSRASSDLSTPSPVSGGTGKSRSGKAEVADQPILYQAGADGKVSVWADLEYPGVQDVVRHLGPSGFKEGDFARLVPRRPTVVRDVDTHARHLAGQQAGDGLPVFGEVRTVVPGSPDLYAPGNRFVFEVGSSELASKLRLTAESNEGTFEVKEFRLQKQRMGRPRVKMTPQDLAAFGGKLNKPGQSPFETHDWVSMSTHLDDMSTAEAKARLDKLATDVRRSGGELIRSTFESSEEVSADGFVDPTNVDEGLRAVADQFTDVQITNTRAVDLNRAMDIADAYEALPDHDTSPETVAAYEAFAAETADQYKMLLAEGVKFEWTRKDPYGSSAEMIEDFSQRKTIRVFLTDTSDFAPDAVMIRPIGETATTLEGETVELTHNDVFRGVHDLFAHAMNKNQFGPLGEENAWRVHAAMYSADARRAMTSETRGQNSWVNFNRTLRGEDGRVLKKGDPGWVSPAKRPFAPQKQALLPAEWSTPESPGDVRSVSRPSATVFGLKYDRAASLARRYEQTSFATPAGKVNLASGVVSPATNVNVGPKARQGGASVTGKVDGREFRFAGEYDAEASQAIPEDINELMSSGVSGASNAVGVVVELGGLESGVNVAAADSVWKRARQLGVDSSSAIVHGDLYRPEGTVSAIDHTFMDEAGRQMAFRARSQRQALNGHKLFVPESEGLSLADGDHYVANGIRTASDARNLMTFDQDTNTATIDGDVSIVFAPDAEVQFSRQGNLLNVAVDGAKAEVATVSPLLGQIIVGAADMMQGAVIEIGSRGKVTKLEAGSKNMIADSVRMLNAAGVDTSSTGIRNAEGDLEKTFDKRETFQVEPLVNPDSFKEVRLLGEEPHWTAIELPAGNTFDLGITDSLPVRTRERVTALVGELASGGTEAFQAKYGPLPEPTDLKKVYVVATDTPSTRGVTFTGPFRTVAPETNIVVRAQSAAVSEAGGRVSRFHVGDSSTDATLIHEWGHSLLPEHLWGEADEISQRHFPSVGRRPNLQLSREVSWYAGLKDTEVFPEVLAQVMLHPEKITPTVDLYLREMLELIR